MTPFDNIEKGNVDYFKEVSLDVLSNSRDQLGDSLLSRAVLYQDLNCVEVIYERCPELLYCENFTHVTALHHAAARDNLVILKIFINAIVESQGRGAKKRLTRVQDFLGHAPLMVAVKNNKPEAVKLLIVVDPDFHHPPDNENQTPLKLCMSNPNLQEMFKLLLEIAPSQSKTPMGPNGWTILHYAAYTGHVSTIADIHRFCPDCSEVVDSKGQTFLHIASQHEQVEVLKFYITNKKDFPSNFLSMQDINGWTSLHHAASRGDLSVVMDIINFCPDCLELVDNEGMNFLHVAAKSKSIQVVKRVLGGRKIPNSVLNKQDNNGNTPFHIAALFGDEALASCFLYDNNVNKKTVNKDGQLVLNAINFEYDKRKARVYGFTEQLDQKDLKEQIDFELVVGALIATVSFTVGITVPGGYISDGRNKGTAVLSKKIAFQVFVISNTLALLFSLYAVFSHYCIRRLFRPEDILHQLKVATYCTLGALYAMMAAFIAGSFAVLADSTGLAISVCAICCCFYIFSLHPIWKIAKQEWDGSFLQSWISCCYNGFRSLADRRESNV